MRAEAAVRLFSLVLPAGDGCNVRHCGANSSLFIMPPTHGPQTLINVERSNARISTTVFGSLELEEADDGALITDQQRSRYRSEMSEQR